jgi:hypothetical protein
MGGGLVIGFAYKLVSALLAISGNFAIKDGYIAF